MRLDEALARFIVQMQADGRSPHTIAQYTRTIGVLQRWMAREGRGNQLDAVTHEVLAQFLISRDVRDSSRGGAKRAITVNATRTALRVFFGYAQESGYAATNAARLVRRAICSPPEPRALNDVEAQRLIDTLIVARGPVARRDHLLIALMLATGIRLGSALALDANDVDITSSVLHLRCMKRDRTARVFFGRDTRDHLIGYIGRRPRGPLFTGPQGERLSQRQAHKRITTWLERAGIEGRTPHSLRHSFALSLYARTHDVLLVRTALHHRSLASTLVYAQCSDERLRSVMQ
jgi:integrase/recombinase XerC